MLNGSNNYLQLGMQPMIKYTYKEKRPMCGARPHPRHAPGPRRRSGRDEGGGTGEDPTTGMVQQAGTTTIGSS